MKWNVFPRLHSHLYRLLNADTETGFYEGQESSEPVFWLLFGIAMLLALVSVSTLTLARLVKRA